jgi:hypothetical protein
MDPSLDIGRVHPAVAMGDFFETSHFEAMMVLNRTDKLIGFQQRFVGTRVEPSDSGRKPQRGARLGRVGAVDAGNFEFVVG